MLPGGLIFNFVKPLKDVDRCAKNVSRKKAKEENNLFFEKGFDRKTLWESGCLRRLIHLCLKHKCGCEPNPHKATENFH